MDAPYNPESKPVCGHAHRSGEPDCRSPSKRCRRCCGPAALAGRAPSATIASRSARENRKCLPTKQHGTRRSAARRRNHDSRTCNTSAACPGVNNNTSPTTTPPKTLQRTHLNSENLVLRGHQRPKNLNRPESGHPRGLTASGGHAHPLNSAAASAGHDEQVSASASSHQPRRAPTTSHVSSLDLLAIPAVFTQDALLDTRRFIAEAKKRGLSITLEDLQDLHTRGTLFPLYRVSDTASQGRRISRQTQHPEPQPHRLGLGSGHRRPTPRPVPRGLQRSMALPATPSRGSSRLVERIRLLALATARAPPRATAPQLRRSVRSSPEPSAPRATPSNHSRSGRAFREIPAHSDRKDNHSQRNA